LQPKFNNSPNMGISGMNSYTVILLSFVLILASCVEPKEDPPKLANCESGFLPCANDSTICCEVTCPPGFMLGGPDSTDCIEILCSPGYILGGIDSTECIEVVCPPGYSLGGPDSTDCMEIICLPGYYLGGIDSSECLEDFVGTELHEVEYFPTEYRISWSANPSVTFSEYNLYKSDNLEMERSELIWLSSIQADTSAVLAYDSSCEINYLQLHAISVGGLDSSSTPVEVLSSSYSFTTLLERRNYSRSCAEVIQMPDSAFIMFNDAGPNWPYSDVEMLFMVHTNQSGVEQYARRLESWWWVDMSSVSTYEEDLIYVFNSGSDVGSPQGSEIRRSNMFGIDIWSVEHRVGSMGGKYLFDHIVSNQTITAVGEYTDYNNEIYNDLWVISYDLDGNELWSSRYTSPDTTHSYEKGFCLAEMGDGYLVACAARTVHNGSPDLVLFNISSTGHQIWSEVIQSDFKPVDMIQTIDGNYIIIGESSSEVKIMGLSNFGTFLWVETIGGGSQAALYYSGDQNLIVSYNPTESSFSISTLSISGNTIWSRNYPSSQFGENQIFDVIATYDGGYVVVGEQNYWDSETSDQVVAPVMFKMDCGGNILNDSPFTQF